MTTTDPAASRRHAMALAAMLTATVVTAIAAVGGLTRWNVKQAAPASPTPITSVVPQAPAAPVDEGEQD